MFGTCLYILSVLFEYLKFALHAYDVSCLQYSCHSYETSPAGRSMGAPVLRHVTSRPVTRSRALKMAKRSRAHMRTHCIVIAGALC